MERDRPSEKKNTSQSHQYDSDESKSLGNNNSKEAISTDTSSPQVIQKNESARFDSNQNAPGTTDRHNHRHRISATRTAPSGHVHSTAANLNKKATQGVHNILASQNNTADQSKLLHSLEKQLSNGRVSINKSHQESMSIGGDRGIGRNSSSNSGGLDSIGKEMQQDTKAREEMTHSNKVRRKRTNQLKPGQSAGRWTPEEHQAFLEGLKVFGREWKKVAERIPTRSSAQIRSHAQKYFAKLARDEQTMIQEYPLSIAPTQSSHADPGGEPLTPGVQRNVDRIMANPHVVEGEVEDTLRQLRERYRQLQICLEESQQNNRRGHAARNRAHLVENDREDVAPRSDRTNKRTFDESSSGSVQRNQDDISSVSSAVSALSRGDLANEELIALSVLGGSLPRSNSHPDLESQNLTQQHRPPSPASSSSSARDGAFAARTDDGSESKRRKISNNEDKDDPPSPSEMMG